ncbi:hypothetical protein F2Q70_00013155 [Brassica cretica]|uniref:Uncharacterized protein n=1 Tax=Brassica cretica TaxID=69181 RepID=A0A8S9J823_BRACR|nr:hypothetical protein F2Q68_00006237 [Brassica cretica]KAF2611550.1 hypothetical protein F2Q70_00013155 [Brassica cretica]
MEEKEKEKEKRVHIYFQELIEFLVFVHFTIRAPIQLMQGGIQSLLTNQIDARRDPIPSHKPASKTSWMC